MSSPQNMFFDFFLYGFYWGFLDFSPESKSARILFFLAAGNICRNLKPADCRRRAGA